MEADAVKAVKDADKGDVGYINVNNGCMRSSKNAQRHCGVRSRGGGLDGAYKGNAFLVSVTTNNT